MDTKQGRRPWLFTLAAAGAAGRLGGRRVQGRRVFVRTVWTSSEDEEGTGKVSTGIGGAPSTGYGAAAGSPRRRRAHEGREVQGLSGCERGAQGIDFGLNRAGKGGGATPSELRPSMAMGAALIALRGAINWRGNGRGVKGGGGGRCFRCS
jgi:type IV secretory pathway TrbL component